MNQERRPSTAPQLSWGIHYTLPSTPRCPVDEQLQYLDLSLAVQHEVVAGESRRNLDQSSLWGDQSEDKGSQKQKGKGPSQRMLREGRISRPPNAWILYRSERLAQLKEANGNVKTRTTQADLSKTIAEKWRAESAQVKKQFELLAQQKKLEHEAKHPGYKFKPRRKADKKSASPTSNMGKATEKRKRRSRSISGVSEEIAVQPSLALATPVISFNSMLPNLQPAFKFSESLHASSFDIGLDTNNVQPASPTPVGSVTTPILEGCNVALDPPVFDNWIQLSQTDFEGASQPPFWNNWSQSGTIPFQELQHLPYTQFADSRSLQPMGFVRAAETFEKPLADYAFPARLSEQTALPLSSIIKGTATFEEWNPAATGTNRETVNDLPLKRDLQNFAERSCPTINAGAISVGA